MSRKAVKRFSAFLSMVLILCSAINTAAQTKDEAKQSGEPFRFQSKVRVVLVPVLVLDANGHAVGRLTRRDFQVFDQDKPQVISGFTIQMRAGENNQPVGTSISTNAQSAALPEKVAVQRHIVFLFDDVHLDSSDFAHVRKAASRMLAGSLNSSDISAVLSTSGRVNTGFTRDQNKLREAIMHLRQDRSYINPMRGCPDINHYQAYMIQYLRDPDALQALADDAKRKCLAPDEESAEAMAKAAAAWEMELGERGTGSTLDVIQQIIRQMEALPGQRTLILISSGFIALTPKAMQLKTQVTDLAAEANVTVSALDAHGLDTLMFDMSNPWIEAPVHERERHNSLTTYGQVLSELASGTGGTYFHNSNDLVGGLEALTKAPEYLYLIEFSPQYVKADGRYHRLKIKVDMKGTTIRTRQGYFAEKPSKETQKHTG